MSSVASANPRSNPPFLGIGLDNHPSGVLIPQVTAGTGAERAGLLPMDIITQMDGTGLVDPQWVNAMHGSTSAAALNVQPPVEQLMERIFNHQIGDQVHLSVIRNGQKLELDAVLGSRADLLTHNLANKELNVQVTEMGTAHSYNLSELAGRATVVGFVYREPQNSRQCPGCARVLDRIGEKLKDKKDRSARVLEVTNEDPTAVRKEHDERGSSLDTAIASDEGVKKTLGFADPERLHITVVDCHGIVRFVALIAPGAEDEDAMIDELIDAVAQCEHRARSSS